MREPLVVDAQEHARWLDCGGAPLLAILATPAEPQPVGVVIVVGGPQYRVGSHRQFTLLARRLAQAGYATLRFDYRGMGDSGGSAVSFDRIDDDIRSAVDALAEHCGRIVLWGLCDGATAALIYAATDTRVVGVFAVNPWARSEESLAETNLRNHYRARLLSGDFWYRLAAGQVEVMRSLREFASDVRLTVRGERRDAPDEGFLARMERGARAFDGRLAILLSERDPTGQEFALHASRRPAWKEVLARATTSRMDHEQADHTFSRPDWQRWLEKATIDWVGTL